MGSKGGVGYFLVGWSINTTSMWQMHVNNFLLSYIFDYIHILLWSLQNKQNQYDLEILLILLLFHRNMSWKHPNVSCVSEKKLSFRGPTEVNPKISSGVCIYLAFILFILFFKFFFSIPEYSSIHVTEVKLLQEDT